jgi:hypothetical protein
MRRRKPVAGSWCNRAALRQAPWSRAAATKLWGPAAPRVALSCRAAVPSSGSAAIRSWPARSSAAVRRSRSAPATCSAAMSAAALRN